MSNSATVDRPIPHREAWPPEKRRQDMSSVIARASSEGWLAFVRAPFVAATFGVLAGEVEAEMMKYLSEGEGK